MNHPLDEIRQINERGYYFDIGYFFKTAWFLVRQNFLPASLFASFYMLSSVAFMRLGYYGLALQAVFSGLFISGFIHAFNKAWDGYTIQLHDFFDAFRYAFPVIAVHLVSSLLVAAGMYLLVLPGVYLLVSYTFVIPFVLLKNYSLLHALEASRRLVTPQWFQYALISLLLLLINMLGVLTAGFGLIITLPFTYAVVVVIFRTVYYREEENNGEDTAEASDELTRDIFR